ncbi:hypothetical protein PR003_g17121 [Phytophthora rubi]|uniref:Uncharacterized protein n=1 Tax=Phytophthora rubi TaxID=129364 RepID=A0A6A3KPP3_9STRA|nr:hypothetical protein PR002_g16760 [Phytophthora rubi]KAE9009152.1 hypothetical protein PR001_g16508 [Phytophthora rubi]KAE9322828.1 hypothetical protein PR003_g17121 [Phytophthora rubi]
MTPGHACRLTQSPVALLVVRLWVRGRSGCSDARPTDAAFVREIYPATPSLIALPVLAIYRSDGESETGKLIDRKGGAAEPAASAEANLRSTAPLQLPATVTDAQLTAAVSSLH